MNGKILVAAVLVASTGSAATIGVVYTGVVSQRRAEPAAAPRDPRAGSPSLRSAVVLSAQEGSFERAAEAAEGPVCPPWTRAAGCVVVSRTSDIRMKIFGYTVSIPPTSVNPDGEDRYSRQDSAPRWWNAPLFPQQPSPFVDGRRIKRIALSAQSDGENRSGGEEPDQGPGGETPAAPLVPAPPPADAGFNVTAPRDSSEPDQWLPKPFLPAPLTAAPVSSTADPFEDPQLGWDAFAPPVASAAAASPLLSDQPSIGGNVPEPSTWLMTLAGFGALAAATTWRTRRRTDGGAPRRRA